ncbi:hypothetical protein PR048_009687 [Dryococelus australis]|uniref:Vitellogenin n=1 Tax=Dryococelus australis TaxID=614101 RepID=A0ABQ9I0K4_9NEOP|nr:hypothetical protein PR048_009687 [Dryococelus australis]
MWQSAKQNTVSIVRQASLTDIQAYNTDGDEVIIAPVDKLTKGYLGNSYRLPENLLRDENESMKQTTPHMILQPMEISITSVGKKHVSGSQDGMCGSH